MPKCYLDKLWFRPWSDGKMLPSSNVSLPNSRCNVAQWTVKTANSLEQAAHFASFANALQAVVSGSCQGMLNDKQTKTGNRHITNSCPLSWYQSSGPWWRSLLQKTKAHAISWKFMTSQHQSIFFHQGHRMLHGEVVILGFARSCQKFSQKKMAQTSNTTFSMSQISCGLLWHHILARFQSHRGLFHLPKKWERYDIQKKGTPCYACLQNPSGPLLLGPFPLCLLTLWQADQSLEECDPVKCYLGKCIFKYMCYLGQQILPREMHFTWRHIIWTTVIELFE